MTQGSNNKKCYWDYAPNHFADGVDAFITTCLEAFGFTGNPATKKECRCPKCGGVIVVQGWSPAKGAAWAICLACQNLRKLTRNDLAQRYGISRSLTYLWQTEGHFPKPDFETGTYVRWLVASVIEWEKANEAFLKKRCKKKKLDKLEIYLPTPKGIAPAEKERRNREHNQMMLRLGLADQTSLLRCAATVAELISKPTAEGRIISLKEQFDLEQTVREMMDKLVGLAETRQQLPPKGAA